jgi:hypothetical protein
MERLIKEVIAQQGWLKRRMELIRKDTDDIHLGMDGLYKAEEVSELLELEELSELEEIESMQNEGSMETEEVGGK